MKREQLEFILEDCKRNARSAWKRGVYDYALMLLDNCYDVEEFHATDLKDVTMEDWRQIQEKNGWMYKQEHCIRRTIELLEL